MEVFVFARLHARTEKRDAVQQAITAVQSPTREEPGCLNYGIYHSVRDADEFYIHSRWRDREAFELHAQLPHTVHFLESVTPLLDHPFSPSLTERLT